MKVNGYINGPNRFIMNDVVQVTIIPVKDRMKRFVSVLTPRNLKADSQRERYKLEHSFIHISSSTLFSFHHIMVDLSSKS